MKLLKGRKLLKRQKLLENRSLKFWGKLEFVYNFFRIRKIALINLIIALGVGVYGIYYLIDREQRKLVEAEQALVEEESGEEIKEEFFETVYEEELEAERLAIEQEERRKMLIEQASEGEEIIFEDATDKQVEELDEVTEDEEEVIKLSPQQILETIDKRDFDKWQIYENKTYSYSIDYPPSWFTDGQTNDSTWLAYVTSYDPAGINRTSSLMGERVEILVQENHRGLSLDDWQQQKKDYFGEPMESKRIKIGGVDAYLDKIQAEANLLEVVFARDNYIYTMSFVGNSVYTDVYRGIINYIISTFKFIQK